MYERNQQHANREGLVESVKLLNFLNPAKPQSHPNKKKCLLIRIL